MTDERRAYEKAICEVAKVSEIGDVSDGFHTFNSLYEQRMILFAALVKAYRDKAWKSYRHEDGEYCFGGGWFIVGIDTPEGSYTYHYKNKYWDMFDCADLPRAKHWDGHTEADAETRLMSLTPAQPQTKCIAKITLNKEQIQDAVEKAKREILAVLPRWISVSERLPEEKDAGRVLKKLGTSKRSEYVLATVEVKGERMTITACTYDGKWDWNMKYAFPDYKIIAWMPLPDPYEGGEQDEND